MTIVTAVTPAAGDVEKAYSTTSQVYDPWIKQALVKNQYHDIDSFLFDLDFVVIMVKHNEIKENMDKLARNVVLDCHDICVQDEEFHI